MADDAGHAEGAGTAVHAQGQWAADGVITIATTLLDPRQYPQQKIADLYGVRWQVETHFGELKTTLKMRRIKLRTAVGVQKELAVYSCWGTTWCTR